VYFPCHSFSLPFPLFIFHSLILQAELNTRHPPPLTCRNFEHLLMCGFHFNTRLHTFTITLALCITTSCLISVTITNVTE
uniref:Uncharacterized protein n=1 Tax=Haplochromis burtoni TaxID=8153 RepID=A0A3Q2X3Q4_HAPBU